MSTGQIGSASAMERTPRFERRARRATRLFLPYLLTVMLAGCVSATPIASHGGAVTDQVSFIDALRAKGLTVEIADSVEQPFLRASGTILRIRGGGLGGTAELQSFNYGDSDLGMDGLKAAAEDVSQIDSSGNPKTMRINWIAPPHFFHRERVIAVYLGTDSMVLSLLTDLFGPQFAGR